ncbi:MAG: hypothetical protein ISS69_03195 [Phycisphaerae bacterium]|nr:hypothetical protein [Phycisphaerae bacterium]
MKSRSTITVARILAFAAMFAAVLGVHAFHILVHPSGHQSDCFRHDSDADNHAEAGVSHHTRGEAVLSGSCPVCEFFKTRPVSSCSEAVDHHEAHTLPSTPVVRADTPIGRHHPLPLHSRAPPAGFPTHIV